MRLIYKDNIAERIIDMIRQSPDPFGIEYIELTPKEYKSLAEYNKRILRPRMPGVPYEETFGGYRIKISDNE